MYELQHLPKGAAPMALLGSGIPLTLLLDLVGTAKPGSREIARTEGGRADWLDSGRVSAR
jgi:hypothetical protein